MRKLCAFRVERQRGKRHEMPGLVLKRTHLDQMLDPLRDRFNVAVEHGRVLQQTRFRRFFGDFHPLVAVKLAVKECHVNPVRQNLNPAARQRVQARFFQLGKHFRQRLVRLPLDFGDLDAGEGFDVDAGPGLLDGPQQVQVVRVRQLWVDARNHVDFFDGNIQMRPQLALHVGNAHCVRVRAALLGIERAELAAFVADIGVVDVLVADIIRLVPAHPLPHNVRQSADGVQVGGLIKLKAVIGGKPLDAHHLLVDIRQPRTRGGNLGHSSAHGVSSHLKRQSQSLRTTL